MPLGTKQTTRTFIRSALCLWSAKPSKEPKRPVLPTDRPVLARRLPWWVRQTEATPDCICSPPKTSSTTWTSTWTSNCSFPSTRFTVASFTICLTHALKSSVAKTASRKLTLWIWRKQECPQLMRSWRLYLREWNWEQVGQLGPMRKVPVHTLSCRWSWSTMDKPTPKSRLLIWRAVSGAPTQSSQTRRRVCRGPKLTSLFWRWKSAFELWIWTRSTRRLGEASWPKFSKTPSRAIQKPQW